MNFKTTIKIVERYVIDNSPAIATAIGVTGVIATALLTGKAAVKAHDILEEERATRPPGYIQGGPPSISKREYFELTWKIWTPPVAVGVLTIASIVAANRIGTRRAAAVAAAYTISEKAWGEYKEKVVEQIGAKKEQNIREELSQDRVNRHPTLDREITLIGAGEGIFLDGFSKRTFKSDVETLRKIENDFNFEIVNGFGTIKLLSELWDEIGLEATDYSREVGWDIDNRADFKIDATMHKGQPVGFLTYNTIPIREYSK